MPPLLTALLRSWALNLEGPITAMDRAVLRDLLRQAANVLEAQR